MSIQIIIILAAILVAWLIFTGLIKIIKTSVGTALKIALIILVLQIAFGINSQQLWQAIIQIPQTLQELFSQQ